jgi:hypothetical protein
MDETPNSIVGEDPDGTLQPVWRKRTDLPPLWRPSGLTRLAAAVRDGQYADVFVELHEDDRIREAS